MRSSLSVLGVLMAAASVVAASAPQLASQASQVLPLARPADITPLAQRAVILGLARAGERLVGVGERGVVLLSDDAGGTWRQATDVPVSVTLTAVKFADPKHGWIAGHSGIVLATQDGGEHWRIALDGNTAAALSLKAVQSRMPSDDRLTAWAQQLVSDGADKPFLDLHFIDDKEGFVVGAYGLAFATHDGGATWSSLAGLISNPKGLHLNVVTGSGQNIVIAGEQGLVLRSADRGASFAVQESPYKGSWFTAYLADGGQLVLGGLRGKAYFTPSTAGPWNAIDVPAPSTLTAFAPLSRGRLLAVNQAGQLLIWTGTERMTEIANAAPMTSSLLALGEDRVVAAGLAGLSERQLLRREK